MLQICFFYGIYIWLTVNWEKAQRGEPLDKIEPLK